MIVFDEFPTVSLLDRSGHVDPVRYPNFARLAAESSWFPYATASFDETGRALESMLSGITPERKRPVTYAKNPRSLFTFLGRHRYRMTASEEVSNLCPRRLCPNARPQNRASILRGLAFGRPKRVTRWLSAVRPGPGRRLYLKHILFPHVPLHYLPSGRHYSDQPHEVLHGLLQAFNSRWSVTQAYQRHLLQLGYTDRLLGRILDRLRDQGLYDRALVVVTADNGESFGRFGNRHEISRRNAVDIALTPLFVKRPFQSRGAIVRRHVRTLDIVPTIANVLGLRVPWRTQGRSVFGPSARRIPGSVTLVQRTGHRITLSYRAIRAKGRAALRTKLGLFGSGDGPPGLFGIGPDPRLRGTAPSIWPWASAANATAQVNNASALLRVSRVSGYVPTHITGRLAGRGASRHGTVAVAVNDVIVATSPVFALNGVRGRLFSVMVPESSLREGRNDMRIFGVGHGPAGTLTLAPLN
jgi:hypothetical protein